MAEQHLNNTRNQNVVDIPGKGKPIRLEDYEMDESLMSDVSMESMQDLFDQTVQDFREGEVVTGRVVEVLPDRVILDIGYKSEGIVMMEELGETGSIELGDTFDVYIEEPENEDGMPILSKIKADRIKNWTHIQKIFEEDGAIEGKVMRRVKGGLKVDIGIDAFMPASQLTWRPTGDLDRYIGETMEVKIIKLTKRRRNVVVSRRRLLEEQRAGEKERLLNTIAIGQTIKGEVKNITDFGAFVDVGGIDGLLHVTDMSWGRVKHPSQAVSVGEQLEVMVLNFDPHTERISLGLKQRTENPWKSSAERYPVGGVVRGKVVSMTDYGAFVQLEPGIEGMVHISEMSWTHRVRHPSEVMELDSEVDVMVLSVDPQDEKIALGLKQTLPNPWSQIAERYPVGSVVKGTVRNLTDYGAFVQIEEGIDGLLHVSDVSWTKKVNHPSEVLEKGQELDVKILSIDPANEKISVGLKQLDRDPWQEVLDALTVGNLIEVEIAKLVSFGAFAKLASGVEGLIHVSELSSERVNKPEEVLSVGDVVKAKVISIDPIERKIGLSMAAAQREQETGDRADYARYGSDKPGGGTVSIGEMLGDSVPQSLLRTGDPTASANEMMAELRADATPKEAPPVEPAEESATEAAPAEEAPEASAEAPEEGLAPEAAAEEATPEEVIPEADSEATAEAPEEEPAPEAAAEEATPEEAVSEDDSEATAEAAEEEPTGEATAESDETPPDSPEEAKS